MRILGVGDSTCYMHVPRGSKPSNTVQQDMASPEETKLVNQLYCSINDVLNEDQEFTPAQLSRTLRDAVCSRGLYVDTNFNVLNVIDQLARFRSGVTTSKQLKLFFVEKQCTDPGGEKMSPCDVAEAIANLSEQQAVVKLSGSPRSTSPNTPQSVTPSVSPQTANNVPCTDPNMPSAPQSADVSPCITPDSTDVAACTLTSTHESVDVPPCNSVPESSDIPPCTSPQESSDPPHCTSPQESSDAPPYTSPLESTDVPLCIPLESSDVPSFTSPPESTDVPPCISSESSDVPPCTSPPESTEVPPCIPPESSDMPPYTSPLHSTDVPLCTSSPESSDILHCPATFSCSFSSVPGPRTPSVSPPHTPPISPTSSEHSDNDMATEDHLSPTCLAEENDNKKKVDDTREQRASEKDGRVMVSFPVSIKTASTIIGARGRTVKSIEETTSTKIDILNQTTDRLVVVRGDPANCEAAMAEIKKTVANNTVYYTGVLYEASWKFLMNKDAGRDISKIAEGFRCNVMEFNRYGHSKGYLFIERNSVGNVNECVTRISELELEFWWQNNTVKTTILSSHDNMLKYSREELLLYRNQSTHPLPSSPLPAEAAEVFL